MSFAHKIATWQKVHGRSHLPWQQNRDAYRVWLSEIMLQQTQVSTVLPYYERFLQRFPCLKDLALADLDEVMPYWAGLGYYARARNLHKCAQTVWQDYNGEFPSDPELIAQLPGIGPSTANAIAAFVFAKQVPILDGNVKRVLARYYGVKAPLTQAQTLKVLWDYAYKEVALAGNSLDISAYTQGQMDLGSMICTRTKPQCLLCPVNQDCYANLQNEQAIIPVKAAKKSIPTKQTIMLIIRNEQQVLTLRKENKGIWGGLYSLPEFEDSEAAMRFALRYNPQAKLVAIAGLEHTFSHFKLQIQPYLVTVANTLLQEPQSNAQWLELNKLEQSALPAPVMKLLSGIATI